VVDLPRRDTRFTVSIWELTVEERWTLLTSGLVVEVFLFWWLGQAFPQRLASFNPDRAWDLKLVEFERDRVQAAAKGIGGAAAGFLASLLTAAFKDDIQARVSAVSLVGCVAGAVGALMLAATMSASTRTFVSNPSGAP
jgi:hypothetical protein